MTLSPKSQWNFSLYTSNICLCNEWPSTVRMYTEHYSLLTSALAFTNDLIANALTYSFEAVVQGDSKRLTQLKNKRRLNTRLTVGCGIPSSLLALRVDLRGLRSKLSWIRLTFSDTRRRPELLPLHRQPVCSNWWFQRQIISLVGGWMLKRRWNARCTAVADSVLMNSRTQKILCCIVAILLSTDVAARLCARRAL